MCLRINTLPHPHWNAQGFFVNLFRMSETDIIAASNEQYLNDLRRTETSKVTLFDRCAERVRAGLDTADTLAARTAFTAVTIRKELRSRGVQPLPAGAKPRKTPAE